VPPPSFDAATASPAELRLYGIPPEPAADSPEYPKWKQMIDGPMNWAPAPEALVEVPPVTRRETESTSPISGENTTEPPSSATTGLDSRWSGYMDWNGGGCSGICSPTYTHSTGYFIEPASNNTTPGCTEVASYTWAGIGGWHTLESTLAQDGTGQQAPNLGPDEAFYEVIHPKEEGQGTIAAHFKATPEYYFTADTEYVGNNKYTFYMYNWATHQPYHATATGALWGKTTEFVVERPRKHNLYNFKSVTFQGFTNGKAFREYPNERIDMQSGDFVKEQGYLYGATPSNIVNNYEFTDNFHICTKATEQTLTEELESAGRGGSLPVAVTDGSSEVTGTTAKLSGAVNPEGTYTTYHFEYGTEAENYSADTPENVAGEGSTSVPVAATATSLLPGTTYHYRITANSAEGTAVGTDKTFKTSGTPPPPAPTVTTEGASGIGATTATLAGTVNPNGLDTHYYFEYGANGNLFESFAPTLPGKDAGSGSSPVKVTAGLTGLTSHVTYCYRLVASNSTGTSYGIEKEFSTLFAPPAYSLQFGQPGSGAGQLNEPWFDAIDADGNIWVAAVIRGDTNVNVYSGSGTYLRNLNLQTNDSPEGIAVNQTAGLVYVTFTAQSKVEEFSTSGEFIRIISNSGYGEGQVVAPTGVAVDGSGNVWVVDNGNSTVEEFSSTGTFLKSFGSSGKGNGQFGDSSYGITIDSLGHVYVVDSANDRVEEFSSEGSYLHQFGSKGSGEGQMSTPFAVASDPRSGNIFVTDQNNNRVDVFSSAGTYRGSFGEAGQGNGQFDIMRGIAIDSSGDVYVVDAGNRRVEKFLLGGC
jgi:DNA-binding beta-propeller fold protein YncE